MNFLTRFAFAAAIFTALPFTSVAETLRHPPSLEEQMKSVAPDFLAHEARRRGDAKRGALVFYRSAAACATCHLSGTDSSPLGPDLAKLGEMTDVHVIEALLHPSKSIRKGYETYSVLTTGGDVLVGMIAKQDKDSITLRVASDLTHDKTLSMGDVEAIKKSENSMMPDGLVASLGEQRDFLDLASYVMEVAAGGAATAAKLKPSAEQLVVKDDTTNLDHAKIIRKLGTRDFDAGKAIYHGYCFNCHGNDGNTPSLPTARAFGNQKMKFGSDPYQMFMTLSRGNGLMSPMSHLTPKERYQVVHFIRKQFMEPTNPDFFETTKDYLAGLPHGTKDGTEIEYIERDFGPALASQLERKFTSVLTVKLGSHTIAYDLNRMDQAAIWKGGFLDLSNTQHARDRGEGTAEPKGERIAALSEWRWGHEGTLDYDTQDLPLRAPLPNRWMSYHGHHLSGDRVTFSYEIDGRAILESPTADAGIVSHLMEIGPGNALLLAVARGDEGAKSGVVEFGSRTFSDPHDEASTMGEASKFIVASDGGAVAGVVGDTRGMKWSVDDHRRLVLHIPKSDDSRVIEVSRSVDANDQALAEFGDKIKRRQHGSLESPQKLTAGGPLLWPDEMRTVGILGLEQSGYTLDTLTLPDATPWNTWFRTSALDFFPDGRMVVVTYGGDVWIVTGVDEELTDLRWKRFAAGLYEPFGVKVIDGLIMVTCKDRLTRLHDRNQDGEADFYESFSADTDVSVNFHAFNFDLQTDEAGNLFYSKSGHGGDSNIPGAVIKVSADGKHREVFSTGFRTPNGMGMLPGGIPVNSDNQGQWTPASKINVLQSGGFYGWVPTYSIPGMWEPGDGKIDVKKVVPPKTFDPPLVWMPQDFDNSSGGQHWVEDERWGPLSSRLLHTSFGRGWMSYAMPQEVDGVWQAAIIKLPYNFRTGIMRARTNPADGQVYATGLQGWNGGGRIGLLRGGVQRLRYLGNEYPIVDDCKVVSDGLQINFNFPLDPDSATDLGSYVAMHWNYHWRAEYGSDMYSPTTDQPGPEKMNVTSVSLRADGKSIQLNIPDLKPVDQVHLILDLKRHNGTPFTEEIYWTINRVP